ncbi:hypothetical protein ACHHYP_16181 [Achlya hypogyna]|uniref:Uncharacterized protein n=1 Tax=Achlya hypogyna TaxID=1202772 RepID=A0A1V9Y9M7_ACHHY|nr:hypothetical protein ACHHYP_16181 [Achlya hypogyna]
MFNLAGTTTSFRHLIGTACSSPTASMTSEDDGPRTYPRADLTTLLSKTSPQAPVAPEMKCQYKTGTCTNMRTTKKNGKLLMLCELHRRKQNEIKKRSDRKQSALRMTRRLEAKMKAGKHDDGTSSSGSDEFSLRRKLKRPDIMDAYPIKKVGWDHHEVPQLPALPRVSAWRTKDGIATGTKYPVHSPKVGYGGPYEFTSLLSNQFFTPEWRQPLPSLTPTGTVRGNDLAILEFFLEDS